MQANGHAAAVEMAKGALAGAVGVLALDGVAELLWRRENPRTRARERAGRPEGIDPAHLAARRVARLIGRRGAVRRPGPGGTAVHWGLGVVPGAAYALLRHRARPLAAGRGTLFGLGLFLLQDELFNRLLRLAGPLRAYPWQAHVRGLVAHTVFGAATDLALRAMDRAAAARAPALPANFAG